MYNKHIILFLRALLFASHWINWGYIYINHQLIPRYANKMALRSKIICLLYIKGIICIIHKTEHIEYIYIKSLHTWRNITTWWWKLKAWVLFPLGGLVRKELSVHLLQVQLLEPKEQRNTTQPPSTTYFQHIRSHSGPKTTAQGPLAGSHWDYHAIWMV